jgi:hypothetical protein
VEVVNGITSAFLVFGSFAMAEYFRDAVVGNTDAVHDSALNPVGLTARDIDGRVWVYMKGVASCVEGSWVTYDEAGVTTLLAANAKGPVAVAGAAIVANKYGWFCVSAPCGVSAMLAANCADNVLIGREGADGVAGDGRAAGDEIYNAISRGSTAGASALTTVQINHPFVDDANGA